MLCPKCGFISFDHLADCVKCHHDLSGIGAELHGTASLVEGRLFLGALLKQSAVAEGGEISQGAERDEEGVAVVDEDLDSEVSTGLDDAADGTLIIEAEDLGPLAEDELVVADEAPVLEFDFLDAASQLEAASEGGQDEGESVAESPVAEEPVQEIESEELRVMMETKPTMPATEEEIEDEQEMGGPAAMAAEIDAEEVSLPPVLEIDDQTLDLDVDEEGAESALDSPEDDSQPEGMTIDLKSIDLSDLVHKGKGAAAGQADDGDADDDGLTLDDTMDLSLLPEEGESSVPAEEEPALAMAAAELDADGLTLMDEALEELAVDPGRKQEVAPATGDMATLELSMEESDT